MRKKRQKHIEVKISSGNAVNDCVVFMTAYHFDKVIKDFPHWKHKQDFFQIFCENRQNLVKQRITSHFLTTDHPNYYEFTTRG